MTGENNDITSALKNKNKAIIDKINELMIENLK
jgi:hypothetical protein